MPCKRNIIHVNQGVVFREAVPEKPNSPSTPAEDKGKRITTEPFPPTKRQRTVPIPELREGSLASKAEMKDMVIPYLSLDEAASPSGQALAAQAVTSVVEALNLVGGDFWTNFHQNRINNLLDLGLQTSVVVSILSLPICFIRTLCPPLSPASSSLFSYRAF